MAQGRAETKQPQDPESVLNFIIGEHGNLLEEYGGFLIEVLDNREFPWANVFRVLLKISHMVWVELRDDRIVIVSKPKPD